MRDCSSSGGDAGYTAEEFSDKGLVAEIAGTMVGFLCEVRSAALLWE